MTVVLDYSNWRPPSAAALKAAGVVGVVRYIAPKAWAWPKALTKAELDGYLAAGIAVAFNFEAGAGDWQGGRAKGEANGQAIDTAMAELGQPMSQPVFVSYDTYVPVGQFGVCAQYHSGALQGARGRPLDAYGENQLIDFLVSLHIVQRGWMSESTSFPGNSAPTASTVLRQLYGLQLPGLPGAYDVNNIIKPDWGQTPRPFVTPIVRPDYMPAYVLPPIVSSLAAPGGAWLLGTDGGVFAFPGNVPFYGSPHGKTYFAGKTPAQLVLPNVQEAAAGKHYVVVTTDNSRYAYPE